jgi:hypothetical protein
LFAVDATNTTLGDVDVRAVSARVRRRPHTRRILQMFKRLHSAYCDAVSNAFYIPSESIAKSR